MSDNQIRFDDGAAYERYMGVWSQIAGGQFLDWIAPEAGVRWLDIGCGNGAFTETIVQRCKPSTIAGIDPSEAQLSFARSRAALKHATIQKGDAMALPFPDDSFDVAVMPLVIFFVPEPSKGVSEMARVVAPGGTIAAYAWDIPGMAFPYQALWDELRSMGRPVALPPSPDASKIDVMQRLWTDAGLQAVETREINVERTYAHFEDYWTTIQGGPSVGATLKEMPAADVEQLQKSLRARLPADATGRITCSARANAVKGSSNPDRFSSSPPVFITR